MSKNIVVYQGGAPMLEEDRRGQFKLPLEEPSQAFGSLSRSLRDKFDDELQMQTVKAAMQRESFSRQRATHKEWMIHYIHDFKIEKEFHLRRSPSENYGLWSWGPHLRSTVKGHREDKFIVTPLRVGRGTIALSVSFFVLFAASVLLASVSLVVDMGNGDLFAFGMTMAAATFGLMANKRAMRELNRNGKYR